MNTLNYGLTPKMKPVSPRRTAVVVALDVGTSKITCLIARLRPNAQGEALRRRSHAIEVLGFSHAISQGIKGGAIVDLAEAEVAVRNAIALAERSAKVQVDGIVLSLSAGRIGSERLAAEIDVQGACVSDHDIARALQAGYRSAASEGRVLLHALPIGFSLDGTNGVREPRGMLARRFGLDMHLATADLGACRNLMLVIERCHLDIEAMVASAYASGLSTLADDEADVGAAVIDFGAGTTTLAVFGDGRFVHADGFALGGNHVTMDLARGLSIGLQSAERIKTLYGSVMGGGSDDRDLIALPAIRGEDAPGSVSRAMLTNIIRPRVEEILEMVRDRLATSPFSAEPRGRIVLTGGGSLLTGLADLAGRVLGRPVSLGRPLGIAGMPDVAKGPAFAAAAGLLVYPQAAHLEHFESRHTTRQQRAPSGGYVARVGRWLRESF
ncbi:MAG: cell division protein FtsA [Xanthobacteraceae bacterium]|jgi:cell division protein FtsA